MWPSIMDVMKAKGREKGKGQRRPEQRLTFGAVHETKSL